MAELKDVVGYEGRYQVSREGVVFSIPKVIKVGNRGGTCMRGGHPLKPSIAKRAGHLRVWLADGSGKKQPKLVHRLVAEAWIPNPDNLPLVNHLDGNGSNPHADNLEWTTHSGNCSHAVITGLTKVPSQVGAKNTHSRLTGADIIAMRSRYAEVGNAAQVAREFGIGPRHALDICKGRKWAHVIAQPED
ncbi:MAG: NUMOD4 domain-containing protein [Dehalococcoidia bacterium]